MQTYKSDNINIRINPILKQKFMVSLSFLSLSEVLNGFILNYVRDFEKIYWTIPVWWDKTTKYKIITEIYWLKISKTDFEYLEGLYPKTNKDIALYW